VFRVIQPTRRVCIPRQAVAHPGIALAIPCKISAACIGSITFKMSDAESDRPNHCPLGHVAGPGFNLSVGPKRGDCFAPLAMTAFGDCPQAGLRLRFARNDRLSCVPRAPLAVVARRGFLRRSNLNFSRPRGVRLLRSARNDRLPSVPRAPLAVIAGRGFLRRSNLNFSRPRKVRLLRYARNDCLLGVPQRHQKSLRGAAFCAEAISTSRVHGG